MENIVKNNYIKQVNSIAIDVCLDNGDKKILKLKLKYGIVRPNTLSLYFDYHNSIVTLEISYLDFEFQIMDR